MSRIKNFLLSFLLFLGIKIFANNNLAKTLPYNDQTKGSEGLDHLPHDVYGLFDYPWLSTNFLWWLGIVFICLLILGGIYFFLARKNKKIVELREDPLVLLRKSLRELEPERPFDNKKASQFYFELGFLFRELIEKTCSFQATGLTLRELKTPLKSVPLSDEEKKQVWIFFEQAEYIKFAKKPATYEQAEDRKNEVLSWSSKLISFYRQEQAEAEALRKQKKKGVKGYKYD